MPKSLQDERLDTANLPSFKLDGHNVPFKPGDSIMQAAESAGHYIPHLCYHKGLSAHGSCRLCMVKSGDRMVAACTTPAQKNQTIGNDQSDVNLLRRLTLQMLFAEGNHFCPSCESSGNCQLQALAYSLGMQETHFEHFFPSREIDASHADIFLDLDRCINCALCERASDEVDHKQAFIFAGRGIHSHLQANSESGKLGDTRLTIDDAAAHVCPVGAILFRNGHYQHKPGQRRYDSTDIKTTGNLRPDDIIGTAAGEKV